MKCTNCGHYINPKTGSCIHCGAKPAVHKRMNNSIVLIMRIVLAICVVCFFLPFVSVSYDNMKFTASGLQLAFGNTMSDIVGNISGSDDAVYNVFAVSAFVFAVLALLLSCIRNPGTLAMTTLFSFLSAAFVILCLLTFDDYYDFFKIDTDTLDIKNHFIGYVIIILHIAAGVLATSPHALKKPVRERPSSYMHERTKAPNDIDIGGILGNDGSVVTESSHSIMDKSNGTIALCRNCGRDITGAKFCDFCGTPVSAEPIQYSSVTDYELTDKINTNYDLGSDMISESSESSDTYIPTLTRTMKEKNAGIKSADR